LIGRGMPESTQHSTNDVNASFTHDILKLEVSARGCSG